MAIHPLAVVSPGAQIGEGVEVGPFAHIADHTIIGPGTVVMSHAMIHSGTRIGARNVIHPGAVMGGDPQDKKFEGGATHLETGARSVFREFVTVSRATKENEATRIGSDCLIMTGTHIGHDSFIGDHVTVANSVHFGGHVEVHDRAVVGGLCAIHQFVRIGTLAMVGGDSGLQQDAPPFMITSGAPPALVYGINAVGLKRNGVDEETRKHIKKAFKLLYRSDLTVSDAVEAIKADLPLKSEIAELLKFIADSKRGLSSGSSGNRKRQVSDESDANDTSPRREAERVLANPAIRGEILRLLQEQMGSERESDEHHRVS